MVNVDLDLGPKGLAGSLAVEHAVLFTKSQTVWTIAGRSLTEVWRIYSAAGRSVK